MKYQYKLLTWREAVDAALTGTFSRVFITESFFSVNNQEIYVDYIGDIYSISQSYAMFTDTINITLLEIRRYYSIPKRFIVLEREEDPLIIITRERKLSEYKSRIIQTEEGHLSFEYRYANDYPIGTYRLVP